MAKRVVPKKARALKGARKRGKPSLPPPDDALLRHEELNIDRTIAGDRAPIAAKAVLGKPKKTRQNGQPSTTARTAQMRLRAIEHTRRMSHLTAAAAPVAPSPGASNWVQMGPSAIPNGQTYSS